jgi:hypothetical protein
MKTTGIKKDMSGPHEAGMVWSGLVHISEKAVLHQNVLNILQYNSKAASPDIVAQSPFTLFQLWCYQRELNP